MEGMPGQSRFTAQMSLPDIYSENRYLVKKIDLLMNNKGYKKKV